MASTKNQIGYSLLSDATEEDEEDDTSTQIICEDTGLRLGRTIGLINGLALIIGQMIGSGIFVSPKGVLMHAHSVGASLIVWCLCGMVALVGATCYSELGTSIPKSAADYSYITEGFGPTPAFFYIWVVTMLTCPMAIAVASLTFANYLLEPMFPTCRPPEHLTLMIAGLAVGNCDIITYINKYNLTKSVGEDEYVCIQLCMCVCMYVCTCMHAGP